MEFNFVLQRHGLKEQFTRFTFVALVIISASNGFPSANPKETLRQDMPVRIREMHVNSKIRYGYCRTQVVSTVVNTNPYIAQEINLFMRIPRNAFISNFTFLTENETYQARVVERELAASTYQTAKDYSNTAITATLIQSDRDSKTFNVSLNIEANAEVDLIIVYEEQIKRENGHYTYKIYMHPQQMKTVEDFIVQIDMQEFYPISNIIIPNLNTGKFLELYECANFTINGSKADVSWEPGRNRTHFEKLVSEEALGQFSIQYYLESSSNPGKILLRNGYFVHTFNTEDLPILPKHVIFVLDISGSMMGIRLKQLQTAMKNIFDELRVDDYFNIITFSTHVKNWSPFNGKCSSEVIAFPQNFKNVAVDFIEDLKVHGSTNIYEALEEAIKISRKVRDMRNKSCMPAEYNKYMSSNVTSMILFLTDGEPTSGFINRPEILEKIKARNCRHQIPIFSLAFGDEADFNFVRQLSLQNHGFSRRVYEAIDSDIQLEKFYKEISSPVVYNVAFLYTSPVYNISQVTFHKFSMINKDSEIQISGLITPKKEIYTFERNRNSSIEEANSTIPWKDVFTAYTTKSIDSSIICYCDCDNKRKEFISADTEYNPNSENNKCHDEEDYFMERRWAYMSIMNLIDSLKAAENITTREKIVNMSIQYQFVTPYTSLVVVKPNRNQDVINVDAEDDQLEKHKNPAAFYHTTRRPKKAVTLLSAPVQSTPGPLSEQLEKLAPSDNNINLYRGFGYFQMRTSVIRNQNHASIGKQYNLTDIHWLGSHGTIPYKTENSSDVYSLYQNEHDQEKISYQSCRVPGNRPGTCKHLKDCIVKEILTDFNLFLTSYFCPIITSGQNGKFIGTCCQGPDDTRT